MLSVVLADIYLHKTKSGYLEANLAAELALDQEENWHAIKEAGNDNGKLQKVLAPLYDKTRRQNIIKLNAWLKKQLDEE